MSSVAVHNNLSHFIDAVLAGDRQAIAQTAEQVLKRAEDSSELLGQIGLIAMDGDSEGHTVLTLGAASALCRKLIALRHAFGDDP
jgi:aspartate oxidase